jgi:hypothetical protein
MEVEMRFKVCIILFVLSIVFTNIGLSADALWVGTPTYSPAEPMIASDITVQAVLRVRGGTLNNFRVTAGYGSTNLYDHTFESTAVGNNQTITFTFRPPNPGELTINFLIDPDRISADAEPNNNNTNVTINVRGLNFTPQRTTGRVIQKQTNKNPNISPDLGNPEIVTDNCEHNKNQTADLIVSDFQDSYTNRLGVITHHFSFKIKNTGRKCIGFVKWRIIDRNSNTIGKEGELRAGGGSKYRLEGGEEKTVSGELIAWDFSVYQRYGGPDNPYAAVWIAVIVDPENEVEESDEGNNRLDVPNVLLLIGNM